jgi:hypothetical protein
MLSLESGTQAEIHMRNRPLLARIVTTLLGCYVGSCIPICGTVLDLNIFQYENYFGQ